MTDSSLHVTLGHNASAALAIGGHVIRAYEQERIDRIKGSSAYPRDAIKWALQGRHVDVAYVGHWFDDVTLKNNKYLDLGHLHTVAHSVVGLTASFTHHDSHATSAMSFFRSNRGAYHDADIFVLDGFGTNQECFSVYQSNFPALEHPRLVHRTYGYGNSLGLMYQYTTEYLGMKPNQDEYKLLGYESLILAYARREHVVRIKDIITAGARAHARMMLDSTTAPDLGRELINYADLSAARAKWWACADAWRQMFRVDSEVGARACVAFCAQTFIEEAVMYLIEQTMPARAATEKPAILLTGGCHYNVKLNRRVQVETGRRVFSHPLAGDQGAALGFVPDLNCSGLDLGERPLGFRDQLPQGVEIVDDEVWVDIAANYLQRGRIVNVVRGDMEFGPRALCNTTTFALPTRDYVRRINMLNERDETMPMAPVMTRRAAALWLVPNEVLKITPSDRYMITTCAFISAPPPRLMGVAHKDPLADIWTARPQIVDSGQLKGLLRKTPDEILINTSYNYHGEPIVFSEDDACKTHSMQCFRAQQLGIEPPVTLIVRNV